MYVVAANLSYRVIGDRIIAMDVAHNRYHGLSGTLARTFRSIANGHPSGFPTDAAYCSKLHGAGLLEKVAVPRMAPEFSMPWPTGDVAAIGYCGRPRFAGVIKALILLWFSRALLRYARFVTVLRLVQSTMSCPVFFDRPDKTAQLLADFRRAQAIMIFHRRCLPDSIAFLLLCRKYRDDAKIVFGVKTAPFQAHCWVQTTDTVLNDAVEHVRAYQPIGAA